MLLDDFLFLLGSYIANALVWSLVLCNVVHAWSEISQSNRGLK